MKNRTLKQTPKTGLLFVLTLVLGMGMRAQGLAEAAVPAKARQALQSDVPGAKAAWSAGPNSTYEAKFNNQGQNLVYVFDKNGLLNEKKQLCKLGGLPEQVSTSIAAAYPGVEHQAAYKVITRQRQRYFEVVVPGRGTLDYMRFNVNGSPVGKTSLALAEQPIHTSPDPADLAEETDEEEVEAEEPVRTNTMPMRGESSTTTNTTIDLTEDMDLEDDLMDDAELEELLNDEDDESLEDLLNDEDDWEDIDLLNDLEDEDDWEDIDPLDE